MNAPGPKKRSLTAIILPAALLIVLAPFPPFSSTEATAATVEFTMGVLDGGGQIINQTEVSSLMDMRHKDVVLQQRDYSCGAASLATIFNYYLKVPVQETEIIRTLLELNRKKGTLEDVIRRKGFSMLDLKLFAEERGLKAAGYRLEFEDLANLGVQAIVPIIPDGFKHFVVFRGADARRVYLSDPSFGNLIESIDQFKKDWYGFTNVALAFYPPGSENQTGKPLVPAELEQIYANSEYTDTLPYNVQPYTREFIPGEW
jgi:predicted double-glycine peptidase